MAESKFVWNLFDSQGTRHDDDFFTIVIGTTISGAQAGAAAAGASATAPRINKNKDRWIGPGDWVVVNQQAWQNVQDADLYDAMTDNFVINAEAHDYYVLPSTRPPGEAYRLMVGDPADTSLDGRWTQFKSALTNLNPSIGHSRNLFYFGHGSANKLGISERAARSLSSAEVARILNTGTAAATNRHGYRFVFLDGCNTAKGNFPTSFGMVKKQNLDLLYYANSGERPSVFVGWTAEKWAAFANRAFYDHINYVGWFLFEWYDNGRGVKDAFDRAELYPSTSGVDTSELRIYGFGELRYDQYNGPRP